VPLQVEQQVVRLEVAVDVAARVQRLDGEDGLRCVEARLLLRQHVALHQQRHHVAPRDVLHHQVQELLVLPRAAGVRRRRGSVPRPGLVAGGAGTGEAMEAHLERIVELHDPLVVLVRLAHHLQLCMDMLHLPRPREAHTHA
jgi:hypothetical protein